MTRRKVTGLTTVAVLAAVIWVLVATHYTDGVRPGAAYEQSSIDAKHTVLFQTPLGALTVQTGNPTTKITDYDAPNRAADGAVFVPISWLLAGKGADYSNDVPAFQFQVTLVADGRRYDLQAGHSDEDTADKYTPVVKSKTMDAVVQGDGRHLRVEVEYDGVTQVGDVDTGKVEPGLAAPLYRKGGPLTLQPATDCTALSPADARGLSTLGDGCQLGPVQLTPYVGGLGWVGSSKESWATVQVSYALTVVRSRDGNADYDLRLDSFAMTLDGHTPTTELLPYHHDADSIQHSGTLVFRTTAHPRTLRLTSAVHASPQTGAGPDREFRTDQSFTLS